METNPQPQNAAKNLDDCTFDEQEKFESMDNTREEFDAFWKELQAIEIPGHEPGETEYIRLSAIYKIYENIFGDRGIAKSTARYNIETAYEQQEDKYTGDILVDPDAIGRDPKYFINRKNKELITSIFTRKNDGKSEIKEMKEIVSNLTGALEFLDTQE